MQPQLPNSTTAIPTAERMAGLLTEVDKVLAATTPDWFPCLKMGCCTGDAECCRHRMAASITWLEAEQIFLGLKEVPLLQRREIAKAAETQCLAAEALNPELFAALAKNEMFYEQVRSGLNKTMNNLDHDHSQCPLLDLATNGCSVYGRRPVICRTFGQTIAAQTVILDGKTVVDPQTGKLETEAMFMGCDTAFEALDQHPEAKDIQLANATQMQKYAMDLSSPQFGGMRAPMPMKPICFWLRDLTDGTGDLTNPYRVFDSIRAMMAQALNQMMAKPVEPTEPPLAS